MKGFNRKDSRVFVAKQIGLQHPAFFYLENLLKNIL
jgi:hypothetical protein